MNNQTDVSIRFKNYVDGEKKLERYAQTLAQIKSVTDGLNTGVANSLVQSAKDTKNISKDVSTMAKLSKTAFNYSTIREFTRSINRLITAYGKAIDASTAYLENINLYQVAFEGSYKSADKFIDTMTEMYGLDESWLTRTVGIFKQLSNAMGVSAETGERLSTLLTQMSLDIASLYNVDMERASSVLQSAMAGQTKPIRGLTGGDITQATLQTTLDNLGIQRSIAELSFAEKRLIIIVSLTQQLNESIGDMGRTIESPANQIRVMNSQWDRMTRAVGNVLLPAIASILPYVNAILMVITEILNAVAIFVGYDEGEYDYFAGVADSVLELEDGLEGANASAKKLKQGLRGFDKLNVITTPTSTSSGSGTGGSNIDPDIMNAFNNTYDDYLAKLEKTEMRATKIRDAIMEWLGFSKEIDPLTGEISWKYGGLQKTIGNLVESFSKLPFEVRALVGLFAGLSLAKMIKNFGSLVLKVTGLDKGFASLNKSVKSSNGSFSKGLNTWSKQLTATQKLTNAFIGSAGLLIGIMSIKKGMETLAEQNELTAESFLQLASGIGETTASGALLGATFGGSTGAILGGLGGLLTGVVTALASYKTEVQQSAEATMNALTPINEYTASLQEQREAIEQTHATQSLQTGIHESLLNELQNIVDANGKVKSGYEDRAQFIITTLSEAYGIEAELLNGRIEDYDDYIKKMEKAIETKKIEIALNLAEEKYTNAILNRSDAYKNATKAENLYKMAQAERLDYEQKLTTAWNNMNEAQKRQYGSYEEYMKQMAKSEKGYRDLIRAEREAKTASEEATEVYDDLVLDIASYQGLVTAQTKENTEAVEYYTNQILSSVGKEKLSYRERALEAQHYYNEYLELARKNGIEITEEVEAQAREQYNILATTLGNQIKTVEDLNDDYVDAFGLLAENSTEEFLTAFRKLPPEVQEKVVDEMYEKGYNISKELQKGINAINPEIDVKVDTSQVKKDLLKLLNNMSRTWSMAGFDISGVEKAKEEIKALKFAHGGLPPVGQLFVANEQGAEFVGHLGGQTFVANQNQMMDLLDKKLGQAQGTGQKVFNFYLDESHKIATYTLDQLEEMAVTNGKPITIGM